MGDSAPAMAFIEATDDIALVKPVTDVLPVHIYRGDQELGKTLKLLGRGATGNGKTGEVPNSPHRTVLRRAFNMVTSAHERWLGCRFHQSRDALPLEGIWGHGDSGSPVLIWESGEWQLAGIADHASFTGPITSFVQGKYGQIGYSVRISYYASWIDEVIRAG